MGVEIAGRLLAHRLGYLPERIRRDGYEVFTPPEQTYDLARARSHLFHDFGGVAPDLAPIVPATKVDATERESWRFPALGWLDTALAALPGQTKKLIVLPPAHLTALPREGSAGWQRYAACKEALRTLAARRGAVIADFAHRSMVTQQDSNYWDPLHFRLPIARRVEADLIAIVRGAPVSSDGFVQVSRP